jgi:dTDP-4-dehydrorhamnose 3,5-epimerase
MIFHETALRGAFMIEMKRLEDSRGFFARSFCRNEFEEHGLKPDVSQCNLSVNWHKATLRGMHYQVAPKEEAKLVRCVKGAIHDVIIDLRPHSLTYKEWLGFNLTADDYRMIYVPGGFAHGYLTLVENTEVIYQVSEFYSPEHERGIRWDDPAFSVRWPIVPEVVSAKDASHPLYSL